MKNFIYGIHPVMEWLESGREPESVLIQQGLQNPQLNRLKAVLKEHGLIYKPVPAERLNRITRKNHQGVVCYVSEIRYFRTEDIVPQLFESGRSPLILLLDRITDVRNFGSICRSAACADADLVIVPSRGAAMINADAVKASSGAIGQVKIAREHNLKETIRYLKESGLQVLACTEKGTRPLHHSDLTGPVAVILGSEENGISPEYERLADASVRIAMPGKLASLNVSVAAGIVLFEIIRQRAGSP